MHPYSCTARVHPTARFDGEVQFIAIRVLMQPRSSLVNRQLFNKYFHSHHYYLGGRPKDRAGLAQGMRGREGGGGATDTITRISTSVRIHISTLYTRDSRVVPVLFFFFNTLSDRDNGPAKAATYIIDPFQETFAIVYTILRKKMKIENERNREHIREKIVLPKNWKLKAHQ